MNARDEAMKIISVARKDDPENVVYSRILSFIMRIDSGEITQLGGPGGRR